MNQTITPTRTRHALSYWAVSALALLSAFFTLTLSGCASALDRAGLNPKDPQLADKLVERYRRYDGQ
ncbi:MAG: hypothetical protein IV092_14235 [Burkholderiaceae bacterium]|nr:hypothetical protein [Burkholderiaceae bacterium]MBT9502402.1 hypothetical protein [Burkholderiaceae bacterium]